MYIYPLICTCNNLVNFESLYGICVDFPSTNADITFPRADNDKFILVASFNLSPVDFVLACLSDPARSTKFSLPLRICVSPTVPTRAKLTNSYITGIFAGRINKRMFPCVKVCQRITLTSTHHFYTDGKD